jgi:hypothetical protein
MPDGSGERASLVQALPGTGGLAGDDQDARAQALGSRQVYRQTGNVMLAKQLLRHESVATTQAYLHPTRDDLADALARLQVVRSEEGETA